MKKKKTSLLEYKLQNSQKKISDDLEYLNDLSIDNKKKFNSKSKSENNIKQKKINKKEKINFQLLIKPILTELDESENKNIKNKYTKNKSVKEIKTLENDRKKYGLFNPKEFKILSQIIPNESLNNYQNKYEKLEIEKNEIEDLFQKNQPLKKKINNNQYNILKSDLMLKYQNKEESLLKCNIMNNKTKEFKISKEIKDTLKEIDKYKYILELKMNENISLKNDINDIKVKIERGELNIKKEYIKENEKEKEKEKEIEEENEEKENEEEENEEVENEEEENEEEENEKEENVKLKINDKFKDLNNNNYEDKIENE